MCLLLNQIRKSEFATDDSNLYREIACRYWPISFAYVSKYPKRVTNLSFFGFSKIQNIFCFFYLFFCLFLRQQGDFNVNPGPKKKTVCEHFSCCHWNVNSLAVHNYKKFHYLKHIMLFTIKTWIVVQKYILTVQYQIMKKIF